MHKFLAAIPVMPCGPHAPTASARRLRDTPCPLHAAPTLTSAKRRIADPSPLCWGVHISHTTSRPIVDRALHDSKQRLAWPPDLAHGHWPGGLYHEPFRTLVGSFGKGESELVGHASQRPGIAEVVQR